MGLPTGASVLGAKMAKKKAKEFIQKAVKHPGAATKAAKNAGESLGAWIMGHEHDSGVTGKRARLAKTLRAMHGGKRG
jgi:hypothetical protein